MHNNILTDEQRKLLPLIKTFSKDYYLVGGTAIALHIGHRRSIDFDLFTGNDIKRRSIRNRIEKDGFVIESVLYEAFDQLHPKPLRFLATVSIQSCFESSFAILMISITVKKLNMLVRKSTMKQSKFF